MVDVHARALVIDGSDASAGVLCERLGALLEDGDADIVVCDVGAVTVPDAATVDALARLALTARRRDCRVTLRRVSPELRELLELAGLGDAVGLGERSALRVRRQPEQREQLGVEERGDSEHPSS